jgi:glucosamine--fructose-6-phosphate aminotransferase (isomerizing)
MCGIFGYIGYKNNAAEIVFNGLKNLEYRGYDSWGVAVFSKDKILVKKRVGKIGNNHVNDMPDSSLAIGHTRWATHGGVNKINAHPHLDCSEEIAVIHNGIFENYEIIKNQLIKKGHKFISETDTEVIPHLIEEFMKKMTFEKAVRSAFNNMDGLNAVIAINKKERNIIAVRNGSPLVIGFGNNTLPAGRQENFLSSDASALLAYTKNVYFLGDNEMAVLTDKSVKVIDVKSAKVKKIKVQKLNWKITDGQKGKFPNFMLKEIYEQPQIISKILSDNDQKTQLAKITRKARGTYLVGCGTASYACLAGQYLFSKIAKRHINFAIGSEFGYHLEFLNKDSLVIAVSQSGETMDILESVKKAKEKKAKIVSLTNVFGSSLFRISDYKILINAGPEKAVASTKAFTGMLAHLILFAFSLDGGIKEGQKILLQSVSSAKKVLSPKSVNNIKKLAIILKNTKDIYVIGRGLSYPAALETALKIKEISYIHAEGLAAGELKHGPLALIERKTPCIAFLPNDETYGANLAGAMEMKARGGFIIGISFKNHEVFDYFIKVDDAKEATIIPNVIVAQLLSYYLTIGKGLDPDKPRNLAKSVTVK